jgi:hypothetical protein
MKADCAGQVNSGVRLLALMDMIKIEENQKYLSRIVGEQLSAVSFVMDYLQLQFNDYFLTVLTPLTVRASEQSFRLGDLPYRDALCERIAHIVRNIVLTTDNLRIDFDDDSAFIISLKEEDYVCPEAINLQWHESGQMQMLVI